jgi:dephospho-CoA kinase
MLIVALTGGIATGKSVVADVLKDLGCYIHHTDRIAHELMEPGKPAWKKIVNHFGKKTLKENNTIDRAELGKIVFSDTNERKFLNELIHPLVFKKKEEIIKELRKERLYKIFISEAALTIEAGFADFFDKLITVHCHIDIQIKRLIERDRISRKEALQKIQSQMQSEEKLKYADYIIETSGSINDTVEQTERVYRSLLMDYEMKCGHKRIEK